MQSRSQQAIARQLEYLKLVEKPITEQDPIELVAPFETMKDLTFVFIANSKAHGRQVDFGQEVPAALELISCAGPTIGRTHPFQFKTETDDKGTTESRQRIQDAVEVRVRELHSRPGTSFILIWNIAGSTNVHFETSLDCTHRMIQRELPSFVAEISTAYFSGWWR